MLDSHRIHTARTSPSHRQLPFWVSLLHLLADNKTKANFFRAFASFCTDMDLEFSYVSMLTYFLMIDNADDLENTMHILQLPKVFGFSFVLKNQGHLFPALSLSLSHTHTLFLIPSFLFALQYFFPFSCLSSVFLCHIIRTSVHYCLSWLQAQTLMH